MGSRGPRLTKGGARCAAARALSQDALLVGHDLIDTLQAKDPTNAPEVGHVSK
jgi:hypothetical protein